MGAVMEEPTIWVDQKHGELPVRDAILAITDDWVDYGNCCNATIVDLRDACAALTAEVERLREECRRIISEADTLLSHVDIDVDFRYYQGQQAAAKRLLAHWQPLPTPPIEDK